MITQYIFDGVIRAKTDMVTPGFVQAICMGLIRYMGNSRESENGLERPLMILLSRDGSENSKNIISDFEDALETIGISHGDAGELPIDAVKYAFFDLKFDNAIHIREVEDEIEIDILERGDEIGGIEASMPGGVNYKGEAIEKIMHGIPIPQIAVNQIEHALNSETGFEVRTAEYLEDYHDAALACYKNHKE